MQKRKQDRVKVNSKQKGGVGRGEAEDNGEQKNIESPSFHTLEKTVPTKLCISFPFNSFANNRAILGQKLTFNCNRVITKVDKQVLITQSPCLQAVLCLQEPLRGRLYKLLHMNYSKPLLIPHLPSPTKTSHCIAQDAPGKTVGTAS